VTAAGASGPAPSARAFADGPALAARLRAEGLVATPPAGTAERHD
jgi:hypothetical protein